MAFVNSEGERLVMRARKADCIVTKIVERQLYISRDHCLVLDNQLSWGSPEPTDSGWSMIRTLTLRVLAAA